MNNTYTEGKKTLDYIRNNEKYCCKGEIIWKTAIQYIIEYGKEYFNDEKQVQEQLAQVDQKHDDAEAEGKHLWIGREFEKALIECAADIAKVNTIDIIKYIQEEWMFYEYTDIPYDRAIQLLKYTIEYSLENRITSDAKENLDYIGFEEEELNTLGFGEIFNIEEDKE